MWQVSNEITPLPIEYNGNLYETQALVDPRYPGMAPVYCIFNVSTGQLFVCGVQLVVSTTVAYGLPVINNFNSESYSSCSW